MPKLGHRARRAATVAGIATLGVALSAGGAVAGSLITSADVKNQTLRSWDIAQGGVGGSELRADSVRKYHMTEGSVGWYGELNDFTRNLIETKIENGDTDTTVPDVAGTLATSETFGPTTVEHIGGSFTNRATEMGTITLEPGAYQLTTDGFFISNGATTGETRLQVAVRHDDGSQWGADDGTCFTGAAAPIPDREATCTTSRVVKLDEQTTITFYAFGYQDDQGGQDSGMFEASFHVSAIKVG